jgi:hypothetical protein
MIEAVRAALEVQRGAPVASPVASPPPVSLPPSPAPRIVPVALDAVEDADDADDADEDAQDVVGAFIDAPDVGLDEIEDILDGMNDTVPDTMGGYELEEIEKTIEKCLLMV